jgi:tetratricopeptide (TPR) repeat protein
MNDSSAAIAMAAARFQLGDAAAAAELLGPVLAGEPDNVRALVLMTHAQLALKKPELAYESAYRAVEVAPESAEALSALSRAFTGLDRHYEAVELALQAARIEPENAYRHNRLAWALLGDGRRAVEAEHAARQAVALDPNEADFRITYAMVMKQLHYEDRARQALHDALALEPDNAVAQHELATLDVVHRNPFALGRLARGASWTWRCAASWSTPRSCWPCSRTWAGGCWTSRCRGHGWSPGWPRSPRWRSRPCSWPSSTGRCGRTWWPCCATAGSGSRRSSRGWAC